MEDDAPDVSLFFLDAEDALDREADDSPLFDNAEDALGVETPDVSPFLLQTEDDLEVDADDESPFFFLLPFCFLVLVLLLLSPSV